MELARTILITLIAAMMAASGTTKTQTNAESMTVRIHGLLTMHAAPAEEDMMILDLYGKAILLIQLMALEILLSFGSKMKN